jgi:acetylornithine deacetylase
MLQCNTRWAEGDLTMQGGTTSATAILERLVAFPTVSRDENESMIRFMAAQFSAAGGEVRVLPGVAAGKANLLARFGPEGGGGIVLSGHSDVVPVDKQDWGSDPFTLTARGERLIARGATDMKGFLACAMALAGRLDAASLARPLHIAVSHDEEIGCVGVRSMLKTLAAEGFAAQGAVIGEPTGMRAAIGHKGKIAGCLCCRGEAAHSANPALGCNAVYLAADMIAELRALQDWLIAHGARDAAYEVPYSTVHVGTIHGGTALNIVPAACDVEFEFRLLPGDAPAGLLARLRAAGARLAGVEQARGRRAAVELVERNAYPGLETAADSEFVALVREAGAGDVFKAGFGSEAGLFDEMAGLPALVCGPGSIDRAHKADEFILRDELAACDLFLDRLVAQGLR